MPAIDSASIPVARPALPPVAKLLPYLQEIDANRFYTSYGPLAMRLHRRLAEFVTFAGDKTGHVVTTANATLGMTLSLMALRARPGDFCILPAWTFVATPHAAVAAGLRPFFVDVDEASWMLTPEIVRRIRAEVPGDIGAVAAVSPFGRPVNVDSWDRFRDETGIPVLVDAAAGFDRLRSGRTPVVVSMHATKILGVGEGGFVASTDVELIIDIARRANFGFFGRHESVAIGLNAKLSEYHAAVGLAGLDCWSDTRAQFDRVAGAYRRGFAARPDIQLLPGYGVDWVSAACVIRVGGVPATGLAAALAADGIDSRAWWGRGCHREPVFADAARTSLPVTDMLADCTIGLPCFPDMTEAQVQRVCDAVIGWLDDRRRRAAQ